MDLFIIRHGIAVERKAGLRDRERYLTDEGIEKMHIIGKGLKKLEVAFDKILTSPYKRAIETAQIIAEETGYSKNEIIETDFLEPLGEWVNIFDLTEDAQTVAIFGHDPMFSEIVSTFICSKDGNTPMKKGGLCKINVINRRPPVGDLVWFIPTKIFEIMESQ